MRVYTDFTDGRPVDTFATAVRAGANASYPPAFTPVDVLDGMESYLRAYWGPNLLPYAPGGGIENAGMSRAINEMLLQAWPLGGTSGQYALKLFPFWPSTEPASFSGLLSKGGFAVSAAFDAVSGAVVSPVSLTAQHTLRDAPSSRATFVGPWTDGALVSPVVTCGGVGVSSAWDGSTLSFDAPRGVPCSIARGM